MGGRRVDFLVEEIIPVEIKAIALLENRDLAQSINYLEAFNLEIGIDKLWQQKLTIQDW